MHPNFHFTAVQILWTVTFAAQLVLLVVLLGRDRAKRFPWFTLSIFLMALRLLMLKMLAGRLPTLTLSAIVIVLADLSAIAGLLVVVEMGRRAFAPVRRMIWLAGALAILLPALIILASWGPWPPLNTLAAGTYIANLRLMQLGAQKLDLLVDVLTVELGLLVILLGRRFGAGWRSHAQRIVIGLSTASLGQLAVQLIWESIARSATPHSQAEYDRVIGMRDKFFNANGLLYVAVLVWWIVCLWIDEPGTGTVEPPESPAGLPQHVSVEDENASLAGVDAGAVPAAEEPEPQE